MSAKKKPFVEQFPLDHLVIDQIEVSFRPVHDSLSQRLSRENVVVYSQLLEEVQVSPKTAFKKVLDFKQAHPNVPEVDNLLTYLYLQKRQNPKAERLIEESFQKYPDYFFAKLNFADQCLRKKQFAKIETIFPGLDLKKLYPNRKSYHVSEFRGFMTLMSHYHLAIGRRPEAEYFYKKAYLADPAHVSVMLLEKKLFKKPFFKKWKSKLQKLAQIS